MSLSHGSARRIEKESDDKSTLQRLLRRISITVQRSRKCCISVGNFELTVLFSLAVVFVTVITWLITISLKQGQR